MRKTLIAAAIVSAIPMFGIGAAQAEDSPISGNVTFVSDYVSRGYSWSAGRPAVQGGLTYSHESGFYTGLWGSSISDKSWGNIGTDGVELDLSVGYAGELGSGVGFDIGAVHYAYPGSQTRKAPSGTDSTEIYVGVSYEFLSAKYFRDIDWDSNYYSLDASFEVTDGISLIGGIGYADPDSGDSVTNWKVGVATSYAGLDLGLTYIDSDGDGPNFDNVLVLSVGKSF